MSVDNTALVKAMKYLGVKFPIARISKDLGYSKGVVSEYYNGKKVMSGNFIEQLENFYKIKLIDFMVEESIKESTDTVKESELILIQKKLIASQEEQIRTLKKELDECRDTKKFTDKQIHGKS